MDNSTQRPTPMNRLLQGDVGAGKTIVALLAAVVAMENGLQVAFMAPTEILAEQHFLSLRKLLEKERKKAQADPHLVHELLRALGRIGGDGVQEILLAAAADPDWRYRLAAAEVLPLRFRDDAGLAALRALLKGEAAIVRETAAIATGAAKLEPLFDELILLMREGNLRSKKAAYEAMVAVSGQDYGYAPDAWEKWLRDKKAGRLDGKDAIVAERISVGTYYNFKIYSDRVLFVVDVSGSMEWPEFHPNRIEVAQREITRAIRSLRPETLFNVMSFAGHVETWQKDGEVPATPENIEGALGWCEKRLLPRGPTNTHLALTRALEDNPLVDTVYFLSDGMPSAGQYELPEEILIKLRYENRFRKVIFNTIALAIGKPMVEKASKYEDPDEMTAFMQMIADWNGGVCIDIRKPWSEEDLKKKGRATIGGFTVGGGGGWSSRGGSWSSGGGGFSGGGGGSGGGGASGSW